MLEFFIEYGILILPLIAAAGLCLLRIREKCKTVSMNDDDLYDDVHFGSFRPFRADEPMKAVKKSPVKQPSGQTDIADNITPVIIMGAVLSDDCSSGNSGSYSMDTSGTVDICSSGFGE